jgi:hypothetical protein
MMTGLLRKKQIYILWVKMMTGLLRKKQIYTLFADNDDRIAEEEADVYTFG